MHRTAIVCLCMSLVWATPLQKSSQKDALKNIGSRIISGERAREGQFPWQVGLRINGRYGSWFCGGSIIDQQWIVTAAHCVDGADDARVIAGIIALSDSGAVEELSTDFIVHQEYNEDTLENDIGLIRLAKPLEFGENIASIRLSEEPLGDSENIIVSGWGVTSDKEVEVSNDLNFVHLRTISNGECEGIYGEGQIFECMVCASPVSPAETGSPCNGDSGGPVILEGGEGAGEGGQELVAIISFVSWNGCEGDDPSGYLRVAPYVGWIWEQIGGGNGGGE